VLKSADQTQPNPPSPLSSVLYARDHNETKNLGGTKSTVRAPEQTEAVKFCMVRRPLWACCAFPVNPPWPPCIKGENRGETIAHKVRWCCTRTIGGEARLSVAETGMWKRGNRSRTEQGV
jgi:hypothetical protein